MLLLLLVLLFNVVVVVVVVAVVCSVVTVFQVSKLPPGHRERPHASPDIVDTSTRCFGCSYMHAAN
jgi:hypothetical protein